MPQPFIFSMRNKPLSGVWWSLLQCPLVRPQPSTRVQRRRSRELGWGSLAILQHKDGGMMALQNWRDEKLTNGSKVTSVIAQEQLIFIYPKLSQNAARRLSPASQLASILHKVETPLYSGGGDRQMKGTRCFLFPVWSRRHHPTYQDKLS